MKAKQASSKKIKIGVLGSSGKMGLAITHLLQSKYEKQAVCAVSVGRKAVSGFSVHAESLKDLSKKQLDDVDVWIEFSSPEGLRELLSVTASSNGKTAKIVSGTTGLSEKDFSLLKKASNQKAIFWASNMSPGLWAFRQAMKALKHIAEFDFSIDEIHHTLKKDQPSGTAKTLHGDLCKITGKKIIEPTSRRIGGVFGVHTVFAASESEVITLQHQALNRSVFADGAIKASLWLAKSGAGYYSMDDLFT